MIWLNYLILERKRGVTVIASIFLRTGSESVIVHNYAIFGDYNPWIVQLILFISHNCITHSPIT